MDFVSLAFDSLLERIAHDYGISKEELVGKYMKAPAPALAPVKCSGFTAKQTPCKNKCTEGSNMCHLHAMVKQAPVKLLPKPPRVPKPPKVVKEQPVHNHVPGVKPTAICQLCATHGNALNHFLPKIGFVITNGMTLRDRLKANVVE